MHINNTVLQSCCVCRCIRELLLARVYQVGVQVGCTVGSQNTLSESAAAADQTGLRPSL
jgi:hypothetical protein